ncbi:MAG: hypothetical protein ABFD54_11425 [Armatimonadota bacterium]
MTATYDPTLPTLRDHIRLALGDTDTTNPLVQDETINAKLTTCGYCEALAQLAEALASEFAQRPDSYAESGGLTVKWGERVQAWQDLADSARSGKITPPYTTGSGGVASRTRAAVGKMHVQASLTHAHGTVMQGFRAD